MQVNQIIFVPSPYNKYDLSATSSSKLNIPRIVAEATTKKQQFKQFIFIIWSMKLQKTVENIQQLTNDYCHRGLKKPENIHIQEAEIREFGHFFLIIDSKR